MKMSNLTSSMVSFFVHDVTGTISLEKENVQGSLPAAAVASSLAAEMQLPANVPWGLRNDETSDFLKDDKPIGEQIESGESVTVTPKTHLG
jgi:hypothetical protein